MPEEDRESEKDRGPSLRPFWSGVITFGLVSVPVNLFPAYRSSRESLRMVARDGTPLERRYYCPAHEREIGRDEIVRGYEVEENRFVVVRDEELDGVEPKKSREIDLQRFVDREELDPVLFDRAYFLTPGSEATKPYRLLAETMERTGRAGIARFVMRGHEYLVAILSDDGILRAETMRFEDEIRSAEDVGVPTVHGGAESSDTGTLARIQRAVEERLAEELDEEELSDRSAERLRRLVDRKLRSGKGVVRVEEARGDGSSGKGRSSGEKGTKGADVIDLVEVLKRNLQASGRDEGADGGEDGSETREALRSRTKDELYERAQEMDVSGRSKMTKDELIDALASKIS